MVPNAPNSLLIVRVVFRNVTPSYGDEESTLVRLSPELVFVRGMLLLYLLPLLWKVHVNLVGQRW
jgi:hypothetical protein